MSYLWDDPDTPNTGSGDFTYYDIGAYEYYAAYEGVFGSDGDVDGADLVELAVGNEGLALNIFAGLFGGFCP